MKVSFSAFIALSIAQSSWSFAPSAFGTTRSTTTTTTTTGTTSSTSLFVGPLNRQTGRSQLDPAVIAKYDSLEYPKDQIMAEYVWVDAAGNTRSKTRTLPASKVRACCSFVRRPSNDRLSNSDTR